jgi:hypothetical protein
MKLRLEPFDVLVLAAIAIITALIFTSGCATTPPLDSRQCCKRLSLQQEQMSTFNRYCKVALFLSKSSHKSVGKVVQKNASAAVKVCKFVFSVETDEELVTAGDEQEYYRVRSYIITPDEHSRGWRKILDCDPAEYACEEF